MEGIIHIRIDDRLIHGQVATQWTNDLGATRIMAINDEVATNPTLKTVLRMAAPPNVSTSIITRETAVTNIKAGKYTGQKVLVVVKSPFDILYLIDQGLDIKTVNVGNMSARENTEHLRPKDGRLEPFTLKEVAEELGMHESTISRAISNKSVRFKKREIPLKYFFISKTVNGDSKDCVEERIKALIASEDKQHPLSDQKLSELMKKEGIVAARRTIAKYREQMGILPAAKRKVY